ncbi:aminoglycoside phosphotransferase family protein [Paenibacillus alba]|uniref:Aminoglycoside phosphotransferase family protein n=1 Tax=Paenibacillus alba TaxID=1197127 RepID=A0ABU6G8P4_9BACL|nr:aminoglycoside phosphotransferase family protein [Paenibacillus alba]MEC0229994.1 aminoglycoside phosphotransferase family protein [Paenibacillus alba]
MVNPLTNVDWVEKHEIMDVLLNQQTKLTLEPMEQGFEAEVVKLNSGNESFVLKVWSKRSKPDIRFQFHLLNALHDRGVPVSMPIGWGINPNGDQVLVTSFNGMPVLKVNEKKMTVIAKILSQIHKIDIIEIEKIQFPKYDFQAYFFPQIEDHSDLYQILVPLIQMANIRHDAIIHGDFHLRNIVEANERYTVIDWTNGQLGDRRYDFAWSFILKMIYVTERYAVAYRNAYLLENNIKLEELEVFEALACLRWLLLNRIGGTPMGPNTMKRIKGLLAKNDYLKDWNLLAKKQG